MKKVVVIGGGHAGAEVVTALRQKGWEGEILLISEESYLPYQRPPLSKAYLNGSTPEENLSIKKAQVYERNQVDLMLGVRVAGIDRHGKEIQLNNGDRVQYEYLVIATGTRPRTLDIKGAESSPLFYLRSLDDVKAIKENLKPESKLLIVGAGYIGLELAAVAQKLVSSVTVLEAQERVLARVTSPEVSDFFHELHTSAGVNIRLNSVLKTIETDQQSSNYAVTESGDHIEFDVIVVGIGVFPNVELAEKAGIACDNGILVNEFSQTDDQSVYAIGDCSNHPNSFYGKRIRLESVPNAVEQAKAAAAHICNKNEPYTALPWFWSDQYDIKLQTAGLSEGYDEAIVRGSVQDNKFGVFYLKAGKLIAVDAVNSPVDFMKARQLIPSGIALSKASLQDLSKPWFN